MPADITELHMRGWGILLTIHLTLNVWVFSFKMNQFSHSLDINWVSYNSIQFWHNYQKLASDATGLRARSRKIGLPQWLSGKEAACSVGATGNEGSITGSGRSPGGEHGNPFQYSCLENPHGQKSLAGYRSWGLKDMDATQWLSTAQHILYNMGEVSERKKETLS